MARPARVANLIVLLLVAMANYITAFSIQNDNQVYWVISLDAFGPDCFERHVTPFMKYFRENGAYAPYMNNVFPTKTFVNHFSLATGQYAESHGVLANSLYDPLYGKLLEYSYELFHYNESIIPIWTLNEIAGKHSGCMMWPGSDFKYANLSCTFTQTLSKKMDWNERISTVISWIKHEETPANFIMMYIEEPDEEGHAYSPDSPLFVDMVRKVDMFVQHLQQILILENLEKRVNLIFVSDHGMDTVVSRDFIDLNAFVAPESCKMYGSSPVLQIVPESGFEDQVMTNLSNAAITNGNFDIYNKDNLPARWRVHNDRRFGPITAIAKPKFAFQDMYGFANWFKTNLKVEMSPDTKYGVHGYDNAFENMHAIFMCKGPAFNKGVVVPPFANVDLYNFFCFVLNLKCIPNEGIDRSNIWKMILRNYP